MERGLQHPDFGQVAHNFRNAAEHFERCENLPAVDGGARLLERMEVMMERLAALEQAMNRRFDQVDRRMDGLERRMDGLERRMDGLERRMDGFDRKVMVLDKNFTARLQNSVVIHEKVDLAPLYSVLTGEVIQDCPSTLQELDALTARQVDALLTQLGDSVRGRPDARKRQLEVALGVRSRATRVP